MSGLDQKSRASLWGKLFLPVLLTIVLVGVLWRFIDTEELIDTLSDFNPFWVIPVLLCFYCYQYLRALRLEVLSDVKLSKTRAVHTLTLQSFLNATLPAGMAELSLVYILQKFHRLNWQRGTGSVIIARLWDVAIFSLAFCILVVFSRDLVPSAVYPFMAGLTAILAILLSALAFIVRFHGKLDNIALSSKFAWWNHINEIILHIRNAGGRNKHSKVFLCSLGMWILMYLQRVFIIYSLGYYELGLLTILWIYMIPVELLPVKGIANIGTFEATWFLVLKFFGYDDSYAANLAFGVHIIILLLRLVTAVISSAFILYYRNDENVIIKNEN